MLSAGGVCGVAPAGGVQGLRGYGVRGYGVWGLMLSVGFMDCECVSERISWLINDWSLLD